MNPKINILIYIILFTLMTSMYQYQKEIDMIHSEEIEVLQDSINSQNLKIVEYTTKLSELDSLYFSLLGNLDDLGQVDVTMYQPVKAQTNSRPWETADQSIINLDNPREHRWLAISRDLHVRYGGDLQFGDIVWVTGIGKYNGLYEIRDLMNARFERRIDILLGMDDPNFSFYQNPNIRIFKMPDDYRNSLAEIKNRHYRFSF